MRKIQNSSIAFALITALSAVNLLPGVGHFRELNSNFWLLYLLAHLTLAAVFLLWAARQKSLAIWAALIIQSALFVYYLVPLIQLYRPEIDAQGGRDLRLLFISRCSEKCLANLEKFAVGKGLDVVAFGAADIAAAPPELAGLKLAASGGAGGAWGAAMYTNLKPVVERIESFGGDIKPTLFAKFEVGGAPLSVSVAQTEFPFSKESFIQNELVLRRLSSKLRQLDEDMLVFVGGGISQFSAQLRKFRKGAYLRNASGLLSTFPAAMPAPGLNFDQFFYRGALSISGVAPVKIEGGEHIGLLIEARLRSREP